MKKYSLSLCDKIQQPEKYIYELCKNGKNEFNDFFQEIERNGTHFKYMAAALRILQDTSNNKVLRGKDKIRLLDTVNGFKLFEIKKNILRIYFISDTNGRIIVAGGKKDNQTKNISRIKKIIKNYIDEQK